MNNYIDRVKQAERDLIKAKQDLDKYLRKPKTLESSSLYMSLSSTELYISNGNNGHRISIKELKRMRDYINECIGYLVRKEANKDSED